MGTLRASDSSATPEPQLYRRIIDWPRRLAREGPFLREQLRLVPGSRVLDLGCGTGEHARWLVEQGARVVGVDRSAEMLAAAREAASAPDRLEYVEGDLASLPEDLRGPFDAAVSLGNTLVHILDRAGLESCLEGVARRLCVGGVLLVQILNYEAIVREKRRAFPPSLHGSGDDAELVFLRFLDHLEPGFVEFESAVLERGPGRPSALVWSRRSKLRAWTHADLLPLFESRVGPTVSFGSVLGEPFEAERSGDLILVAERRQAQRRALALASPPARRGR